MRQSMPAQYYSKLKKSTLFSKTLLFLGNSVQLTTESLTSKLWLNEGYYTFLVNPLSPTTHIRVIVEFRIPSYPGPSKERGTEARHMRGKIFRCDLQLYVVRNKNFSNNLS